MRVVGSWIAAAGLLALGLLASGLVRLNQPTAFALFESGSVRLISGAMGNELANGFPRSAILHNLDVTDLPLLVYLDY